MFTMSKPHKTKSRKSQREATPRTNWVRFKIECRKGRRLRVLIYARYSTDEQNPRSIEAQISYCRRFLAELGITDVEIVVLYDKGISGERMFRPGINEVRAGIEAGQWDLIVVEDCSRLFRNAMACVELVNCAVDQDIRVFCINDEVDTADEQYWEDRLYEAARHHERRNKFTSRQIERAHEALWELGAAIGLLKPGYRRKPMYPADDDEPESGPYVDEQDPQQVPILEQLYQRAAALESPRSLAQWLTKIGFRKANNATSAVWTAKDVIALIRRTDYRGYQTFRKIISKKKRVTGERRAARNDADKVLTREMPQLRIVSDALWYQANQAINDRNSRPVRPRGEENPLAGIPRNSREPLSNIFFCGCCHGKMYAQGRNEGGYD
jgi:DNA invertase Pin-like site-specific DNA recombinase